MWHCSSEFMHTCSILSQANCFSNSFKITEFWHKKEETEEKQVGPVNAAPKSRSGAT